MKSNGQVALEFIFLILIVVVYFSTVSKPLITTAQNTMADMDGVARTNAEATKIAHEVTRLSLAGIGSQEILIINIPSNSTILCYPNGFIGFQTTLNTMPYPSLCSSGRCDKNIATSALLTCTTATITGQKQITLAKETNGKISIQ